MIETKTNTPAAPAATRPLPDGWHWVRLGDACHSIRGVTFPSGEAQRQAFEQSIACLTTSGVQNEVSWISRCFISASRVSADQYLQSGDILVSTANSKALVGKSCLVRQVPFTCTFGAFVTVLRPNEGVASEYLAAWLRTDETLEYCFTVSSNTTNISNLRVSDLLSLLVPLPPLAEQRRIAAVLAARMAEVERARAAAESQLAAASALSAAYLRAVFESDEAQQWERVRLGETGQIVSGITLGRNLNGTRTRAIHYLRVANVKDGHLDLSDVYTTEATEQEIQKLRLRSGDLLLTEGGDPDKLGRGTYWDEQITECIHQNHIFRVRFDLSRFSPKFLAAQLGSSYGKAYFLSYAKQTTGIATINQQVLGGFPLMMPPLPTQQRIAAELDTRMAEAARLRDTLHAQLDAINTLPAAFLRRAFNGEM